MGGRAGGRPRPARACRRAIEAARCVGRWAFVLSQVPKCEGPGAPEFWGWLRTVGVRVALSHPAAKTKTRRGWGTRGFKAGCAGRTAVLAVLWRDVQIGPVARGEIR